MSQSYPDLSQSQKKQVVKWATRGEKKAVDLVVLGQFMLDVSLLRVKESLTGEVVSYLNLLMFKV